LFHGKQDGRHRENGRWAWVRRDDAGNGAHGATLQAGVIGASRRAAVVQGMVAGRIRIMMLMMLMMTRALRMLRMWIMLCIRKMLFVRMLRAHGGRGR